MTEDLGLSSLQDRLTSSLPGIEIYLGVSTHVIKGCIRHTLFMKHTYCDRTEVVIVSTTLSNQWSRYLHTSLPYNPTALDCKSTDRRRDSRLYLDALSTSLLDDGQVSVIREQRKLRVGIREGTRSV